MLALSQSVLIKGGRKKAGDLILEDVPGATTDSARQLFLSSDSSAVVHVNFTDGNDSTGDGSRGNPYKTINKADTEIAGSGGSLTNIEWQTDDNINDDITYPFQVMTGVVATLDFGVQINNDLCGAVLVSSTAISSGITLQNCTSDQASGNAIYINAGGVTLNNCRFESDTDHGIVAESDLITITNTLVKADTDAKYALTATGIWSASGDIDIEQNTVIGDVQLDNDGGGTSYGIRIRDNIIEGDVTGTDTTESKKFTVESSNIRGTLTNGFATSKVTSIDPLFQDTTDYKLQREADPINPADFDSPLIKASIFNLRDDGIARDLGAWGYDDSDITLIYQRAHYLPKPMAQNAITITKINRANLQIAVSGSPNVYNDTERRLENVTLNYGNVRAADYDFVEYLNSRMDTTVFLALDPHILTDVPDITASGATASGSAVVNINPVTILSGSVVTIDNIMYYVVYPIPAVSNSTQIVLDRPLETDVTDSEAITVSYPPGTGEYVYRPAANQVTSRNSQNELEFVAGLRLDFIRKMP